VDTRKTFRASELSGLRIRQAIFEKLDVSNRGQLVARLFLDPYQRSTGA